MFQPQAILTRVISALIPGGAGKRKQVAGGFVELTPYGFFSSNYVAYIGGGVSGDATQLPDGTLITKFQNGDVIAESAAGHLVQIDNQGRVVMVRILAAEVPVNADGKPLEKSALLSTSIENGQTVMRALEVLKITLGRTRVTVRMPNGTAVNLPVKCAT